RDEVSYRRRWLELTALVLLPNLFNIWLRDTSELKPGQSLFGRDADIGLYFDYGHAFAQGFSPSYNGNPMEYPQFALLLFWIGERLAEGKLDNYYWAFPTWMLVWQVVAATSVYGIGLKVRRPQAGFLMAAFAANAPFLFQYNYTRFDMAPTALLLAAVYLFIPGRGKEGFRLPRRYNSLAAGLAIGMGFLTKWLPAVVTPFLAGAYIQSKKWRELVIMGALTGGLAVIIMLPFYLADPVAFWYPYKFQGSRKLVGESMWFLVQYHWLDPQKILPNRPWSESPVILLSNELLTAIQLGLVGGVFGLAAWRFWQIRRQFTLLCDCWAAAGLIGVVVFTLANRVYSPQFMVLLTWALGAVFVLSPVGWRGNLFFCGLMCFAGVTNYLVFHLGAFEEEWLRFSLLFFTSIWLLTGWLFWKTLTQNFTQRSRGNIAPGDKIN
ncbi:MAG: hypothetical protein WCS37_21855, partial [Chloroflexota bacterium]